MDSKKPLFRLYLLCCLIPLLAIACRAQLIKKPPVKTTNSSESFSINSSVLRVGSTGDYPPLTSFDTLTHQFQGDEIDLALRLGKDLGKKVIFIKTTWKDLGTDLLTSKFDIAIGGISVNAARAKQFNFSVPLLMDRKVAVFRLADRNRFKDFNSIDQPAVRIMENIGGTNEIFAQKHIQRATIHVIPDNQQVFKALLDNNADVMFTDETEAKYQQKKHPELYWITLNDDISPAYAKAMMFNKTDTVLQRKVNEWLKKENK
ncbi:cyclohexadienyl dehydratase [Pedobacter cryoconitis]|uniref:Cyclohexadienyl dehydratase n=1 Tax=Pedobacter cryoconitis TaxID=188932 RepID=A0A7W8ZJ38_9SPHI|nr:transporter substrate-binding domain-containing protein [Pedobacter cryoconitis]MBB5634770.1 cyclohexadienyl dehydratase [Pedobacter cryoconitis]